MTLEQVLQLARQYGAKSVKLGACDAVEVEMFEASVPVSVSDKTFTSDVSDHCQCGHSIAIEHGQLGCLRGCDIDSCCPSKES